MKLSSPAFEQEGDIPSTYTCDGTDTNPPLEIEDVPEGSQSLVLILEDPDSPKGNWVYWTVWNLPPDLYEIEENNLPPGAVEGLNDFEKNAYAGPCPPSGIHLYSFKLYALDTALDLPSDTIKIDLEEAMEDHIITSSELRGFYGREEEEEEEKEGEEKDLFF